MGVIGGRQGRDADGGSVQARSTTERQQRLNREPASGQIKPETLSGAAETTAAGRLGAAEDAGSRLRVGRQSLSTAQGGGTHSRDGDDIVQKLDIQVSLKGSITSISASRRPASPSQSSYDLPVGLGTSSPLYSLSLYDLGWAAADVDGCLILLSGSSSFVASASGWRPGDSVGHSQTAVGSVSVDIRWFWPGVGLYLAGSPRVSPSQGQDASSRASSALVRPGIE